LPNAAAVAGRLSIRRVDLALLGPTDHANRPAGAGYTTVTRVEVAALGPATLGASPVAGLPASDPWVKRWSSVFRRSASWAAAPQAARAGMALSSVVRSTTTAPIPPRAQPMVCSPLSVAPAPKEMPIRLEEKIAPI
jgi:hypothetical protein